MDDLSPNLRPLFDLELSLGNAIVRTDRNLWTACPLAIIFRDPLHFDEAIARGLVADDVKQWGSRDPHYEIEAGWTCTVTRHSIAGPIGGSR